MVSLVKVINSSMSPFHAYIAGNYLRNTIVVAKMQLVRRIQDTYHHAQLMIPPIVLDQEYLRSISYAVMNT